MKDENLDLFQDAYDKNLPDVNNKEEVDKFLSTLKDKSPEEIQDALAAIKRKMHDLEEELATRQKKEETNFLNIEANLDENDEVEQFEREISNLEKEEKSVKKSRKSGLVFIILIIVLIGLSLFYFYFLKNSDFIIKNAKDKIINDNLVKTGTGLYADNISTGLDTSFPFTSKYYFRGKNPNNYLILEKSCFRIVSISVNSTIKVMYEGPSKNDKCENLKIGNININNDLVWNSVEDNNDWNNNIFSQLKNWSLNNDLNNVLTLDFTSNNSKIVEADWYIGKINYNNQSLNSDIIEERTNNFLSNNPIIKSKVGLLTSSEYLKVSCNKGAYESTKNCQKNNYIFKDHNIMTLSTSSYDNKSNFLIMNSGEVNLKNVTTTENAVIPVMFLKSNIKITGKGEPNNPYVVKD